MEGNILETQRKEKISETKYQSTIHKVKKQGGRELCKKVKVFVPNDAWQNERRYANSKIYKISRASIYKELLQK